jgi:hypothetical protein
MTLKEFAESYKNRNYPHDPKLMGHVVLTDVSTSVLVWSESEFLVELYLMHPDAKVTQHAHPFENIVCFQSGTIFGRRENQQEYVQMNESGKLGLPLPANQWHEFLVGPKGAVFYNISKWDLPEEKASAIFKYSGNPLGPLHKALLEKYVPSLLHRP